MRLQDARRDEFRRLAKAQGYKSRAAFKLLEANAKYSLISRGDRVIDFGAAPGGWLQVSSKAVGERGVVVGLDVKPVTLKERNVKTLTLDVYDESVTAEVMRALGGQADVILSDLAPSVSGIWSLDHFKQIELTKRVLSVAESLLKRRGNGLFKVFEGERSGELRKELGDSFETIRVVKPRASRGESSELYYACLGWERETEASRATARTASTKFS